MGINEGREIWSEAGGETDERKQNKAGSERAVPVKWMSEDEKQMLDWILN